MDKLIIIKFSFLLFMSDIPNIRTQSVYFGSDNVFVFVVVLAISVFHRGPYEPLRKPITTCDIPGGPDPSQDSLRHSKTDGFYPWSSPLAVENVSFLPFYHTKLRFR